MMSLNQEDAPKLMVRLSGRLELLSPRFLYEGNNIRMRYWLGLHRLGVMPGWLIAKKWRLLGRQNRKLFVLRDSLFGQQDNFLLHYPYALMLPPAWILAVMRYTDIKAVQAPSIYDNKAWSAYSSPDDLFGKFPAHPAAFKSATRSLASASRASKIGIRAARSGICQLASQANTLLKAKGNGPKEIARVGAELISASDRVYFSKTLRRRSIIPILVENPNAHEIEEGKGFAFPGNTELPETLQVTAAVKLLQRRLEDGDIAIERYDLSNEEETMRALRLLEQLIPVSKRGISKVWLWVTGPQDHTQTHDLIGENALPYLSSFLRALRKIKINQQRLRIISKPDLSVPNTHQEKQVFQATLEAHWAVRSNPSINLTSRAVKKLAIHFPSH